MTPQDAINDLRTLMQAGKADQMAAYHKVDRPYLGVANPDIDACAKRWRQLLDVDGRLALARSLWDSNIHEARVGAAKLLTQARIKDAEPAVWSELRRWVPTFDAWAIADHAAGAISRRLRADPRRLDTVETWTTASHLWTKRAALTSTLPWARLSTPKTDELRQRERILEWAAGYVDDPQWFIQKAVAWWLRDFSKHDADRVAAFLATHGEKMKPFARREAGKYL